MSATKFERKQKMLRHVVEQGQASVAELSERFDVSEATARRYLDELAGEGALKRVHGGAARSELAPREAPIIKRMQEQGVEKRRIAGAVRSLVHEGETVFLGSGTTVLAVARELADLRDLTVISNSLPVINLLAPSPSLTVIGLGGMVRGSELSMIGYFAEQAIRELRADKVIMGIRSIHPRKGLSNDYLPETQIDRAIVEMSDRLIIVADHTKLGTVSYAFVAGLEAVNTVVTDEGADPGVVAELRKRGVEVILA